MESRSFTATEIWKVVVSDFRKGLEVRRKRVSKRSYPGCFTGPEAIAWLDAYLQTSTTIKNSVSREQVVILLQKFLEADVIEQVQETENAAIESDKSLFHFVTSPGPFNFIENENSTPTSPLREDSVANTSSASSVTLGKRKRKEEKAALGTEEVCGGLFIANDFASSNVVEESFGCDSTSVDMMSFLGEMDEVLEASITSSKKKRRLVGEAVPYQKMGVNDSMLEGRGSDEESEEVWRELVLSRLLLLIDLPSLDGVLTRQSVSGSIIASNVSRVVGMARKVGVACSSVAQTCRAALGSVGVSNRHDNSSLVAEPLPAAAYIERRRCARSRRSVGAGRWMRKVAQRCGMGGAVEVWPDWVTMAMQCLSSWPDGCTPEFLGDLPVYQGFELDIWDSILRVLKEEAEPIINHTHYSLYMEVLKLIKGDHAHSEKACQLCLLLLSPERRENLRHLLDFLHGSSLNKHLQLIPDASYQCNKKLLLEQLSPVVLRRSGGCGLSDEDLEDVKVLLMYMVKNRGTLFEIPDGLEEEVQKRADAIKQGELCPQELTGAVCQRVSVSDYKVDGEAESRAAMTQLLEQIVEDTKSSVAQKKKRLKRFQKMYPDIYQEKFGEHSPLLKGNSKSRQKTRSSLLKRSVGFLRSKK